MRRIGGTWLDCWAVDRGWIWEINTHKDRAAASAARYSFSRHEMRNLLTQVRCPLVSLGISRNHAVRFEVELSRNSTAVIVGSIPDLWYVIMHGEDSSPFACA